MWAILVVGNVGFDVRVASAISAMLYTYAQYHSSTVVSACYINRATLLRV